MPSIPTITIELALTCSQCGSKLTAETCHRPGVADIDIDVDPCEKCLDEKFDKGYEDGKKDGYLEGKSDGYDAAKQENDK